MLLGFLVFVVLLSGLVAYSADTIARKAGRKHLRWFGLRPKSTALVVAVLSGMGISLLSVLAFGLLNRAAVRNILQADQLRVELGQLKKDVAATNAGLKRVQAQRDSADERARVATQQTTQAQRELRLAAAQLAATQQARSDLQGEVGRLQARTQELSRLQRQLSEQAKQGQAALTQSRLALQASREREAAQRSHLEQLGVQLAALDNRTAQAEQKARAAETRALRLKAQTGELERSRAEVSGQLGAAQRELHIAQAQRTAAQAQRQAAQAALAEANRERQAALQARDQAAQAREVAQAQRVQLLRQWQQVRVQLAAATQQREAVRGEVQGLKASLDSLEAQRRSLLSANSSLQASLSSTRADLSRLEVDYTRTNSELSANRNLDLAYSRGDLVYAGTVASVRSLPAFLVGVSGAAQKAGARGNPAARLDAGQRQALENKLRGLNTSTFVQCRAAVNVATGFPVDLSCTARPQTLLYRHNQPIVQANIDLQRGTDALSAQVVDLSRSAVQALTLRGVPPEYITNHGLGDTERLDLLGKLAAQSGSSVTVSLVPRDDVRLGSSVDLVAVFTGH